LNSEESSVREVSRIVGKMNAMSQGIPPAPLFYRTLQKDLARVVEVGDAPCQQEPEKSTSGGPRTWSNGMARASWYINQT
jgi:hypothetical protein